MKSFFRENAYTLCVLQGLTYHVWDEGKRRNKSAVQGFRDFHRMYEKPLKAVHSKKRMAEKAG